MTLTAALSTYWVCELSIIIYNWADNWPVVNVLSGGQVKGVLMICCTVGSDWLNNATLLVLAPRSSVRLYFYFLSLEVDLYM